MKNIKLSIFILCLFIPLFYGCNKHDDVSNDTGPYCTRGSEPDVNGYKPGNSYYTKEIHYYGVRWELDYKFYRKDGDELYYMLIYVSEDECTRWHKTKTWTPENGWEDV